MRNKKGFTLIELIAVVFILALILLIVVPIINDQLTKSKGNLNAEQTRQLETAARQWGLDNLIINGDKPSDKNGNEVSFVTIRELQKTGYLDDKSVVDAKTKEELDLATKICITYEDNQFVYEYGGAC